MVGISKKQSQEARESACAVLGHLDFLSNDTDIWIRKFKSLANNAPKRGVECTLTFKQYMKLVKRAGLTRPDQIGRSSGKYQMGRKGDTGNYEWSNCRFITIEQNLKEWTINGGLASSAAKQKGRTRETHEYLARSGDRRKGRTKYNDLGVASRAMKLKGRTKESHSGLASMAEKVRGRTKETHPYIKVKSQKTRVYRLLDKEGKIFMGKNLFKFCEEQGLSVDKMTDLCSGSRTRYKGWRVLTMKRSERGSIAKQKVMYGI